MPEPDYSKNNDSGAYYKYDGGASATDGSYVLTCIFNNAGDKLLAIDGEKDSKLSLSAETVSYSTKDKRGSWQTSRPSTKSWELSLETVHVMDAESNRLIRQAFDNGYTLCVKQVYDDERDYPPRGGGLAFVTKYEDDSPSNDVISISVTLTGAGKWTWFDLDAEAKGKATAKPSNRGK